MTGEISRAKHYGHTVGPEGVGRTVGDGDGHWGVRGKLYHPRRQAFERGGVVGMLGSHHRTPADGLEMLAGLEETLLHGAHQIAGRQALIALEGIEKLSVDAPRGGLDGRIATVYGEFGSHNVAKLQNRAQLRAILAIIFC